MFVCLQSLCSCRSTCCMAGVRRAFLHSLALFAMILWGGHHHLHFTDEEAKTPQIRELLHTHPAAGLETFLPWWLMSFLFPLQP